jgi:FAD/FMN-containing dehydrogenase
MILNDLHSRLNPTKVSRYLHPGSIPELIEHLRHAFRTSTPLSLHGGRHAMGGQQFLTQGTTINLTKLNRVTAYDSAQGHVIADAGIMWPDLIAATHRFDATSGLAWGIRQKQTGADDLTLGGTIACNAHGRGLAMGPIVDDLESLRVILPTGDLVECSRTTNPDLFRHVVGGYGLFGIVAEVTLRLSPRVPLVRLVDIIDLDDAMNAVRRRVAEGCLYGDFQYAIDPTDDAFLRRGVFACYKPAATGTPVCGGESDLPRERWLQLLDLAHRDKRRAFQVYAEHYLSTHGNVYWSDTMQLSTYIPSYPEFLAAAGRGDETPESLVISEVYVPPPALTEFMAEARAILRHDAAEDIYGTIRAIRRDATTVLPWARDDFACVIFNLRTPHTPAGLARTRGTFERLYDAALDKGGSFYLTYHRWARRDQLLRAYPELPAWINAKHANDPCGILRSDWFDHLVATLRA